MPNGSQDAIVFTSMGMFIIDEIHFPENSGKKSHYNVVGGGGTYAALGSRVITTNTKSKSVGWIIDKGSDFPQSIEEYLDLWNTSLIWRDTPQRLTTRGWNLYGDNEFRAFKYTTPKKRIDVDDLIQHDSLLNSKSFHLICSPARSIEILNSLRTKRTNHIEPIIVWEPVPDSCNPENLESCFSVLPQLNVLTPNAEEAARFFGQSEPTNKLDCEKLASRFIPYLTKETIYQSGSAIVLRCGSLGCFTLTSQNSGEWLPAYHNGKNPHPKVVDPTGGGNTFVGAFTTAFVLSNGDWSIASICGNIGAGLALEQIGFPDLQIKDTVGLETWNGVTLKERISNYIEWNNLNYDKESVYDVLNL